MVTVRAVAAMGDLGANVSSQGFPLSIFYPQKAELHWQLLFQPLQAAARSPEVAGSKLAQEQWLLQFHVLRLLVQSAKENQQDLPIWLHVSLEPNLPPWDLACWDLQLFDVHRHRVEGNDCSAMKSSQGVMSAHFWLHSSKRRNPRGREMEGLHHWAAEKP